MAATSQTTEWPDVDNHTLRGEAIPASQVVCRTIWGTPMLPDGKGGYSLIARINPDFIRDSLIIPPRTTGMVAYRPLPEAQLEATRPASLPTPPVIAPPQPPPTPATDAGTATPGDATAAPAF